MPNRPPPGQRPPGSNGPSFNRPPPFTPQNQANPRPAPVPETTAHLSETGPTPRRRQYPSQGPSGYDQTPPPMQQATPNLGGPTFTSGPPQADPNSLVNPMNNMSFQTGVGLELVPLLNFEPKMSELYEPGPKSILPAGVVINPASPYVDCDPQFFNSTVQSIPTTGSLLKKSNVPLGLVMCPFKTLSPNQHVPLIADVIARCRFCRAYINPFVNIIQTKWKCNLCPGINDLPQCYDYDMINHQPVDRFQRPELNCSVVDYSAPVEYTVRAPHPPIYMFVIDVSYASIQCGMLATVAKVILDSLDRIPNPDLRTKVGFMTVDSALHFYKLSTDSEPQMLVVSDLEEQIIPSPDDLVINLHESRSTIESLLSRIGSMFKATQNVGSALGHALNVAHKMLQTAGGKIVAFQTILPTLVSGDMTMREDPKILGTPKESSLLVPGTSFFKNLSLDCSRSYVCIDLFLFGSQYMDVATLASAAKYSGGSVYHYPGFHANRSEDVAKLRHELSEFLSFDIGLEGVLRLRCSAGLRASAFYGNYFIRSTQLIALSSVTPNHCYTAELVIDEEINANNAAFQAALLYTAINGERRIRVMTLVLPTTTSISEIYRSVDQTTLVTFLAKKAVDRALSSKLDDARDALINKCAQILNTIKTEFSPSHSGATTQLPVLASLRHYPFLTLALIKNLALRGGSTTPSDLRSFAVNHINISPPELVMPFVAPRLYALHRLATEHGTFQDDQVILPPALNLRSDALDQEGIYLLDSVHKAMIYVGARAHPSLIQDIFGVPSYGALFGGKVSLPLIDTKPSQQIQAILLQHRRLTYNVFYQELYVVKEDGDPALRLMFLSQMVEDRTNSVPSYHQFIHQLKEMVNSGKL